MTVMTATASGPGPAGPGSSGPGPAGSGPRAAVAAAGAPASPDWLRALVESQPAGHSLHQAFYTDPAIFAHDMARIFRRHWLLAGHESTAPRPGDYFLHEMGDESIVIVRGRDGVLRGFHNVCRHRGSRLCREPAGQVRSLLCPYHAWNYGLDGRLLAARSMPAGFDPAAWSLKPVHLEVICGLVFISLGADPPDLSTVRQAVTGAYAAYGWDQAVVAHRETYFVDANWKLAVENYTECYHCGPSHRDYAKLHALELPLTQLDEINARMEARTRALGVRVDTVDHYHANRQTGAASIQNFRYALYDGVSTGAPEGRPVAPLLGAFTDYDGSVTTTHMPPSSFFISYNDHGVLYRFLPVAPLRSAMEIVWLVRAGAVPGRDYDLDALTWLWRVTTLDDKRITEGNQQGVNASAYQPGPYALDERMTIRWSEWYLSEIL